MLLLIYFCLNTKIQWKLAGEVSNTTSVISIPNTATEILVDFWVNGDKNYCSSIHLPYSSLPDTVGNARTYYLNISTNTVAFYAWTGYVQIANMGGFSNARMAMYYR